MEDLTKDEKAVARQYEAQQQADKEAHEHWVRVDRATRKLVRLAKIGKKASVVVRISDTHGLRITNQFRQVDSKTKKPPEKIFAPAYARKWKVEEVRLD